jgi:ABC-type sugar transport system ATPase subunit
VFAVNYAAFGVVMVLFLIFEPLGLVGIWRRIQNYFPAVAVQAPAGRGRESMIGTILAVDQLEVVHQRVMAVQGITLAAGEGQIVALLGANGAGKSTTLRAISGFLGIDDARVTAGTIAFKGRRIENRPPHENARRGIVLVLVPERDKLCANLTVAENLAVPVAPATSALERRTRCAHLSAVSAACGAARADRRAAVRRRAADAGARQPAGRNCC